MVLTVTLSVDALNNSRFERFRCREDSTKERRHTVSEVDHSFGWLAVALIVPYLPPSSAAEHLPKSAVALVLEETVPLFGWMRWTTNSNFKLAKRPITNDAEREIKFDHPYLPVLARGTRS